MEQIYADILKHLEWIKLNPEAALEKIEKSQNIFRNHFSLTNNISDIYSGLSERRENLLNLHLGENPSLKVGLYLLMPDFSEKTLRSHLCSAESQEHHNFEATLVIGKEETIEVKNTITEAVKNSSAKITVKELDVFLPGIRTEIRTRRKTGAILAEILASDDHSDLLTFVAPNERIYSNHLNVLAGPLQLNPDINCTASAAVLENKDAPIHTVHELIDFGHLNPLGPTGYGRFMFKKSAIPRDIHIALPYLDGRPLAVLVGSNKIHFQSPATVTIDLTEKFPGQTDDGVAETEIIRDFSPEALTLSAGFYMNVTPQVVAPVASLQNTKLSRLLVNPAWLKAQLHAVRVHGLKARLSVLKGKLTQ
jgi:hypothetical protein